MLIAHGHAGIALWLVAAYVPLAAVSVAVMRVLRQPCPLCRVAWIVVDNTAISYFMFVVGEGGTVALGLFLMVTIGNGFRYGRTYLFLSHAAGLIGMSTVIVISPFWSQHVAIGVGLWLTMVLVPIYVGSLYEAMRRRVTTTATDLPTTTP
jgi:two-component system sensor histidine kinase RpfC